MINVYFKKIFTQTIPVSFAAELTPLKSTKQYAFSRHYFRKCNGCKRYVVRLLRAKKVYE